MDSLCSISVDLSVELEFVYPSRGWTVYEVARALYEQVYSTIDAVDARLVRGRPGQIPPHYAVSGSVDLAAIFLTGRERLTKLREYVWTSQEESPLYCRRIIALFF